MVEALVAGKEIMTLREQLAQRSRKQLIESLAADLEDWAHTDTEVRNLVRPILGEKETDGDSFGVPDVADLVEQLVAKYNALKRES